MPTVYECGHLSGHRVLTPVPVLAPYLVGHIDTGVTHLREIQSDVMGRLQDTEDRNHAWSQSHTL